MMRGIDAGSDKENDSVAVQKQVSQTRRAVCARRNVAALEHVGCR